MIENINDFFEIMVVVFMIIFGIYGTYRIFVKHRAHKMEILESEYYQSDNEELL
ncbi:MAG: hypothetical protein ACK5KQ_06290 [Anaerorhabdus sp.]